MRGIKHQNCNVYSRDFIKNLLLQVYKTREMEIGDHCSKIYDEILAAKFEIILIKFTVSLTFWNIQNLKRYKKKVYSFVNIS